MKRLPALVPVPKKLSPKAIRAGVKRKIDDREPEDIAEALRADSDLKIWNPKDPKIRAKVGMTQAGAYALELLSGSYGTRLFCFSMMVKDDKIYFADLGRAYSAEIQALYDEGVRNIQIDDPHLTYFCSSQFLNGCKIDGVDTDELLATYLESHNHFLRSKPKDLHMGMHLCSLAERHDRMHRDGGRVCSVKHG